MTTVPKSTRPSARARSRPGIELSIAERATLERWSRTRTAPQRLVQRSRIVLLIAAGLSERAIARKLALARSTVRRWRERFAAGGATALAVDAPGRGRKARLSSVAFAALMTDPALATLSVRQLARRIGVSPSAVHRALSKVRQAR